MKSILYTFFINLLNLFVHICRTFTLNLSNILGKVFKLDYTEGFIQYSYDTFRNLLYFEFTLGAIYTCTYHNILFYLIFGDISIFYIYFLDIFTLGSLEIVLQEQMQPTISLRIQYVYVTPILE